MIGKQAGFLLFKLFLSTVPVIENITEIVRGKCFRRAEESADTRIASHDYCSPVAVVAVTARNLSYDTQCAEYVTGQEQSCPNYYISPNTTIPVNADMPINPMGEIPFFRNLSFSFFEPKYKAARKVVMSNADIFTDCSCCVRKHCWIIMKTPVARIIPMIQGFIPRRAACT